MANRYNNEYRITYLEGLADGLAQAAAGTPKTAFGELSVASNTAFIQATGVYNFIPNNFRTYTSGTGASATSSDRFFICNSGTTLYGYGVVQSLRSLNYNAGQGGLIRFAGLYPSNVANSWSGIGLVTISDEFSFGYNGTAFGIWYRRNGDAEVRTITVSTPSSGSTNLTLTLNSVAYTIPLTSGTVAFNAYQIATWLNANQSAWFADQVDGTVIISATSDGAKSGTYTYSHATSTGSIASNTVGVTKTSTHIPQASWNEDNLSTWTTALDPTKGNVFQISYQYLGFGNIRFYVENPETGEFKLVHMLQYPNANTETSVQNPSLRFGMYATSVGSTTDIQVKCSSLALFVQGNISKTRNPRAVKNTQSVTTSFTNILTVRNRRTYNSIYNQVEIEPLIISLSSESTKNVEIEIRTNAVFSGATNFVNTGTNLVSDIDTTANTTSNGTLLASFTLAGGQSQSISLKDLEIRIPPTISFTIGARVTSGASSNVTAALTYYEDL